MSEHIRADCMMPVREAERLREIERAARDVLKWRNVFFDKTQEPGNFCGSELLCDFDNLEAALEGK